MERGSNGFDHFQCEIDISIEFYGAVHQNQAANITTTTAKT